MISYEEIVCVRGGSVMSEIQCMVCGKREENPRDVGAVCGDCLGKDGAAVRLVDEIKWTHRVLREVLGQQQNLLGMVSDLLQRVDQLERDLGEVRGPSGL